MIACATAVLICAHTTSHAQPSYKLSPGAQNDLAKLLSDLEVRTPSRHPKFVGYEALIEAAQEGCPRDWQVDRIVEATGQPASQDEPVEMFLLPPLVRLLYQFETCFSTLQLATIQGNLTSRPQRLFDHGTINHAAMRASSWYLLAQKFPTASWTNWDGKKMSSQSLKEKLDSLLKQRWEGFYQVGHYELLSPTYSIVNLIPTINLIDFASDHKIKRGANSEANLATTFLLVNSLNGTILPPLTRKNYDQINRSDPALKYTPSVGQAILKFYTGQPASLSNNDWTGRGEPPYVIMIALSDWRPLADYRHIESEKSKGLLVKVATPSFSKWGEITPFEIIGESYINKDYAISAGNSKFTPGKYHQHVQTNAITLRTESTFNQIECYHPYFSAPKTNPEWSTDRWAPTIQSQLTAPDTIVLKGEIPEADPWPVPVGATKRYNQREFSNALTQAIFCRAPKDLAFKKLSDSKIEIIQGKDHIQINSLAGEIRLNRFLERHVEFRIDGPTPQIQLSVNRNASTQASWKYQRPAIGADGFVSYADLNEKLKTASPLESRIATLKNGKLRVSIGLSQGFECTAKDCKIVVLN